VLNGTVTKKVFTYIAMSKKYVELVKKVHQTALILPIVFH